VKPLGFRRARRQPPSQLQRVSRKLAGRAAKLTGYHSHFFVRLFQNERFRKAFLEQRIERTEVTDAEGRKRAIPFIDLESRGRHEPNYPGMYAVFHYRLYQHYNAILQSLNEKRIRDSLRQGKIPEDLKEAKRKALREWFKVQPLLKEPLATGLWTSLMAHFIPRYLTLPTPSPAAILSWGGVGVLIGTIHKSLVLVGYKRRPPNIGLEEIELFHKAHLHDLMKLAFREARRQKIPADEVYKQLENAVEQQAEANMRAVREIYKEYPQAFVADRALWG